MLVLTTRDPLNTQNKPWNNNVGATLENYHGAQHPKGGGKWAHIPQQHDPTRQWMIVETFDQTSSANGVIHFKEAEILALGTPTEILDILKWHLEHPAWTFNYANEILKAPFPYGETLLASTPNIAYLYAKEILKAPFPLGEATIISHPKYAALYSLYVRQDPWPDAETLIKKDPCLGPAYNSWFQPTIGVNHYTQNQILLNEHTTAFTHATSDHDRLLLSLALTRCIHMGSHQNDLSPSQAHTLLETFDAADGRADFIQLWGHRIGYTFDPTPPTPTFNPKTLAAAISAIFLTTLAIALIHSALS